MDILVVGKIAESTMDFYEELLSKFTYSEINYVNKDFTTNYYCKLHNGDVYIPYTQYGLKDIFADKVYVERGISEVNLKYIKEFVLKDSCLEESERIVFFGEMGNFSISCKECSGDFFRILPLTAVS